MDDWKGNDIQMQLSAHGNLARKDHINLTKNPSKKFLKDFKIGVNDLRE